MVNFLIRTYILILFNLFHTSALRSNVFRFFLFLLSNQDAFSPFLMEWQCCLMKSANLFCASYMKKYIFDLFPFVLTLVLSRNALLSLQR